MEAFWRIYRARARFDRHGVSKAGRGALPPTQRMIMSTHQPYRKSCPTLAQGSRPREGGGFITHEIISTCALFAFLNAHWLEDLKINFRELLQSAS